MIVLNTGAPEGPDIAICFILTVYRVLRSVCRLDKKIPKMITCLKLVFLPTLPPPKMIREILVLLGLYGLVAHPCSL
jgi:hypothetical protein